MGSPEGEKFLRPDGSSTSEAAKPSGKRPEVERQENLIQNYTRKKGSLVKTSVLLTDCYHNLKNKDYHDDNDFILEH